MKDFISYRFYFMTQCLKFVCRKVLLYLSQTYLLFWKCFQKTLKQAEAAGRVERLMNLEMNGIRMNEDDEMSHNLKRGKFKFYKENHTGFDSLLIVHSLPSSTQNASESLDV